MDNFPDWAPAAGGIMLLVIVIACVFFRAPYSVEERRQAGEFAATFSDQAWNCHYLAKNIAKNFRLGLLLPYLGKQKEWSRLRADTITAMADRITFIGDFQGPDADAFHDLRSALVGLLETQIGILKDDLTRFANIIETEKVADGDASALPEGAPSADAPLRRALLEEIDRKQELAEKRLREAGRRFADHYDLEYSEPSPDEDDET